jgi:hypothetical protein
MAPRPQWHHTMQEARRQACLAVDFYNRPGDRRSYLDFVVHMQMPGRTCSMRIAYDASSRPSIGRRTDAT